MLRLARLIAEHHVEHIAVGGFHHRHVVFRHLRTGLRLCHRRSFIFARLVAAELLFRHDSAVGVHYHAFADKNRCFKAVGLFNVCNLVVYFCNFSATNSVEVAHDVSNFHNFFSLMCTKLSNLRQEI